jgi:hypothetical protein
MAMTARLLTSLLIAGCLGSTSTSAQWTYDNSRDEMRGIDRELAAVASRSGDMTASLLIFDMNAKGLGALVSIEGDRFQCEKEPCLMSAKFDNGKIVEFISDRGESGTTLTPLATGSFAGAVALSSNLILELPLRNSGKRQFKFKSSGLKFKVTPSPAKSIFGLPWGASSSELRDASKPSVKKGGVVCYDVENLATLATPAIEGSGSFCFLNDKFYQVVLESKNTKDNRGRLVKLANSEFGMGERYGMSYHSWPKPSDRVVDTSNTRGALYGTDGVGKKDKAIFSYAPISNLAPDVNR